MILIKGMMDVNVNLESTNIGSNSRFMFEET